MKLSRITAQAAQLLRRVKKDPDLLPGKGGILRVPAVCRAEMGKHAADTQPGKGEKPGQIFDMLRAFSQTVHAGVQLQVDAHGDHGSVV